MRRPGPLAGAVLAVAVLAGCGSGGHATTVAPPARPAAHAAAAASTTVLPPRVVPVSVRIPKIGATSTLVGLGLNPDGTVQVPPVHTPMQAGWYDRGYPPGEDGPAVLLGHVDGDHQAGIFYRLHELAAGDKVLVTRQDGSVLTFTVTHTQKVDKDAFPTNAVYGPTSDPELRLVTCGGAFDYSTYHYVDNLIVYASLS